MVVGALYVILSTVLFLADMFGLAWKLARQRPDGSMYIHIKSYTIDQNDALEA
jgi:hypothetical protein